MPVFRYVPENSGGTFPIADEDVPAIGTWGCATCVGIYFRVDETRCFVAHILGMSGLTAKRHNVTVSAGKNVGQQTLNRLFDMSKWDQWDPKNEFFGSDMYVVCPYIVGKAGDQPQIGQFVIEAISSLFNHWAKQLENDVSARKQHQHAKKMKENNFTRETERLTEKAAFLRGRTKTPIKRNHHGFIFDPSTGKFLFVGDMSKWKSIRAIDLGEYEPWTEWNDAPPSGICTVGVENDAFNDFPIDWIGTNFMRELVVDHLRRARSEFATNLKIADELANRLPKNWHPNPPQSIEEQAWKVERDRREAADSSRDLQLRPRQTRT